MFMSAFGMAAGTQNKKRSRDGDGERGVSVYASDEKWTNFMSLVVVTAGGAPVCKSFMHGDGCDYGDKCKYSHDVAKLLAEKPADLGTCGTAVACAAKVADCVRAVHVLQVLSASSIAQRAAARTVIRAALQTITSIR